MHKCNECDKDSFTAVGNLARHVKFVHKMTYEDYTIKHVYGGERPKCLCGCGEEVKWRIKGGFGKYFNKSHSLAHRTNESYKIVCRECSKPVANTNNILALHIKHAHNMTFEEYLIKHEHNGNRPKCLCGCGEELYLRKGGFPKFRNNHDGRGKFNGMYGKKGKDNPNTGKIRTEEHKEKYRVVGLNNWDNNRDKYLETMHSDSYRENMRAHSLRTSKMQHVKDAKSKASLKWWADNPEQRVIARDRAILLQEQGKIGPQAPFKTEWKLNPFTNAEEYMHSSWESIFLDVNIKRNNPVSKVVNIRIPYLDENNIEHIYIPDFIGLEDDCLYEIKPEYFKHDPRNILKFAAAREWCEKNGAIFIVISLDEF